MIDYSIKTPPVGDVITLTEIKEFLRLDVSATNEDDLLTSFREAAINFCERYTARVLLETEFEALATFRSGNAIELSKTPLREPSKVTKVEAKDSEDIFQEVTEFSVTIGDYPYVALCESIENSDCSYLADIKITFTAGYVETPPLLKMAVLQHIAFMYSNRGDCSKAFLPSFVENAYMQYKVLPI